jgi:hypothetical protein
LADDAVKPAVKIKFLRRELSVAMPGPAPAMQLVPAKIFLHRHNPIAVKHPPYPSFGFGVHALSGMWV